MKYPKIQTLFKRDEKNKFIIIEGEYSKEEFETIDRWEVTEKVDGTNIRVMWDGEKITFRGRTDNTQVPTFLLTRLKELFTIPVMKSVFSESRDVVLFGEGYGQRIQKVGEKYRKDNDFIVFDIVIDGWWLERDSVIDIAQKLNVTSVPVIGIMTKKEIIDLVKSKPKSNISKEELISEGVVVRSYPLMLFRDKSPIMFKLKVVDYEKLAGTDVDNPERVGDKK